MRLARVRTDFNTSSLANPWTLEDLECPGIELREGMHCIFYDLDAEDGQAGFLHGEGIEQLDRGEGFVIDSPEAGAALLSEIVARGASRQP